MDYTKNYKLSKPSYDDDVDVQVLNNNMDILDNNLQNTTNKLGEYLPLLGGTMKGHIELPYGTGLKLDNDHFIEFNTTSNGGVVLPTLKTKADRFKFYCPNGKEFVIDDTGASFDSDKVILDSYTNLGWHAGYVKLSTGLCVQWGYVNPKGGMYNVQHTTFQTPMLNPQYAVVTSRSFGVNTKPDSVEMRWGSATFNLTTTGFDILCAEPSAYGHTEFWLAIGRYK